MAGGIAPKILPRLKEGTFFRAFCDKTLLSPVLARIPIYVVLNEDAPVWGAAYQALAISGAASIVRSATQSLVGFAEFSPKRCCHLVAA